MAKPIAKPDPDMPMKCSAEILEAIKEAPMAHQVNEPSARKNSCAVSFFAVFRL